MKTRRAVLCLFVLGLLFALPAAAQTNKTVQIRAIDRYVKALEKFVGQKKPQLIAADISDYNDDRKERWRKFASEKALEKFRERTETYTIAYNWRQNGRLVRSNFTRFSPSGDWAQYDFYSFRADGTLAKLASELRTFEGDLIVLRDYYFDEKGRQIRRTTRFRDLRSKKPIKKPKDWGGGYDVEIYKSVRRLPFAKLK